MSVAAQSSYFTSPSLCALSIGHRHRHICSVPRRPTVVLLLRWSIARVMQSQTVTAPGRQQNDNDVFASLPVVPVPAAAATFD